jgi:hypothetical protein
MDYETFKSLLGEGFHTGLRKAADSPESSQAWNAIRAMDPKEWSSVVDFVAGPVWGYLLSDPPVDSDDDAEVASDATTEMKIDLGPTTQVGRRE